MTTVVTPERLRPQLQAWLEASEPSKRPKRPVFAIHYDGVWNGPDELDIGDSRVDVRMCPSELAVREALAAPREDERGLVLLTAADQLGADVLARLGHPRVHRLLTEDALLGLFGVRSIDPAVTAHRWLVDALVDAAPIEGYERTGARELDRDRAWHALLRHRHGIKLDAGLDGLLVWARSVDRERLRDADERERDAIVSYLATRLPGAAPVVAAVLAGAGDEVLALGLVARVLTEAPQGSDRVAARTRLELRLDGWDFDLHEASAWARAAEIHLDAALPDAATRARTLQAADRHLEHLQAADLAGCSDHLVSGLRQRLGKLAVAIDLALDGKGDPADIAATADRVRRHRGAADGAGATATMAMRLLRWLEGVDRQPIEEGDLREAADRYASQDSYADWARAVLRQGSGDPRFDESVRRLLKRADAARETQEAAFARDLAAWARHAATDDALLGVEHVLSRVVAPLAQQAPVLVVVLDGMSHRTANELLDDVLGRGWIELRRSAHPRRALAVSALPSVTALSRTSLLSGTLRAGVAADERRAFREHPELVAAGGAVAPRLFHKGDLTNPNGGLASDLDSAISGDGRIVGVVVNAIDDHLARSEQLRTAWSVSDILPLSWLLEAARDAGRIVVLASDHGHVLEHGTVLRTVKGDGGERWRAGGDPVVEGEIEVEGTRVLVPGGRCVLTCGERIRYSPKKNGYHGGATAQEVLAPLVVLAPTLVEDLEGWNEAQYDSPAWWLGGDAVVSDVGGSVERTTPSVAPGEQLALGSQATSQTAWIEELLANELFRSQRAAAGRTPVPDERITAILCALGAHDGPVLREALARACGIPPMRLTGTLAALRQILNVDGYPVLGVDDAGGDVTLNRTLLEQQFELTSR